MLKAIDVACFFINMDKDQKLFTKNLVEKNGRKFWDGNARLNKFLHLAQNLYIAKNSEPLFDDTFFAYDNGAVIPNIQENYSVLLERCKKYVDSDITGDKEEFLKRFFIVFKNATLDELIALSHEDEAWSEKASFYKKEDQKMDSISKVDEYKKQYSDVIKVMYRMACC